LISDKYTYTYAAMELKFHGRQVYTDRE